MPTLTIRRPDDFHVHLRDGAMLPMTVRETARQFARALVMPNLRPRPLLTAHDAARYFYRIGRTCHDFNINGFQPLGTVQLTGEMALHELMSAWQAGVTALKLYPAGVTTNSDNGVVDIESLWNAFRSMQQMGMRICLHGEHADPKLPHAEREAAFIPLLEKMATDFPNLKIVLEHVSSRAGVEAVRRFDNVAATVTPHHLVLTEEDVGLDGANFRPHSYCMPVAKREEDRDALLDAVMGGHPKFFLGTDSAPHPRDAKRKPRKECAAGVFNAPVAMPLLATVFERHGALDRLEDFASRFGAEWYGLPLNTGTLSLVREEWTVPDEIAGVVPFLAGETLPWRLAD